MSDTNVVTLQPSAEEEELPYIETYRDLEAAIRETFLASNTLDPSPDELTKVLLRRHDFNDHLFPENRGRGRSAENTLRTALKMAIGMVCGDRTEKQDAALEQCGELISALQTIVDIDLAEIDIGYLKPLDREHVYRLVTKYSEEAENLLSTFQEALDDGQASRTAEPRRRKTRVPAPTLRDSRHAPCRPSHRTPAGGARPWPCNTPAPIGNPMRIQSRNAYDDGLEDLDPYFTCREAIDCLIMLEGDRLPRRIWEPAAGDGAIVLPLLATGRFVVASDVHDYGLPGCGVLDYLTAPPLRHIDGIVTNPPFCKALELAMKALAEVPYVALLARTNFLVEDDRYGLRARWLDQHPPTRQWWSANRLPMMHRYGWTGKRSRSNTPYAWAVWVAGKKREFPQRFYWKELLGITPSARSGRKVA